MTISPDIVILIDHLTPRSLEDVMQERGIEDRAQVRTVEAETSLGHIPGGQYDAVIIDEAHDFEPEWLSPAVKKVNLNS